MHKWKWFGLLGLLLARCGDPPGVLVDIGSWPAGAVSLRVAGVLDGTPLRESLSFPKETTRFVVYTQEGTRGQLALTFTALDENDCPRATAQTQVELGKPLRRIAETAVALTSVAEPYCPAPDLLEITPGSGSTLGGITFMLSGQNFLPGATVTVDGYPAQDSVVLSKTQLTATLPQHLGAFGFVPVVLQNSDEQLARRSDLFAYYASQPAISSMTTFPTDRYPQSVVTGDWNGDNAVDLAVATGFSTVSILLGDGMGGFGTAKNIPSGSNSSTLAAGDWNGDKKLDLAIVAYQDDSVVILLGDGKGDFGNRYDLKGITAPGRVEAGDVNGDNVLDLVVPSSSAGTVNVMLGSAKGGFGAFTTFPVASVPNSVVIRDFNGDQKADLAVTHGMSPTLSILLGDGHGNFGAAKNVPISGYSANIVAGDLDNDGKLDLVVVNATDNHLTVVFGDGAGDFVRPKTLGSCSVPYGVALADFDGDQNLDMAIACNGEDKMRMLLGDGKGNFGQAAVLPTGNSPRSIAVGDFNGDKKPDIVTPNYFGDNVSVFINQSK